MHSLEKAGLLVQLVILSPIMYASQSPFKDHGPGFCVGFCLLLFWGFAGGGRSSTVTLEEGMSVEDIPRLAWQRQGNMRCYTFRHVVGGEKAKALSSFGHSSEMLMCPSLPFPSS